MRNSFISGLLSVKPLANLAKQQARTMMIKRAEKIGVYWRQEVEDLQKLDWDKYLAQVKNPISLILNTICGHFTLTMKVIYGAFSALEVSVAARAVSCWNLARCWCRRRCQATGKLPCSAEKLTR